MSNKTLGPTGLSYLWSKIKSIFATKAEIDDIIDVIEDNEEVVASALNDLNSRIENMVVEETDPTVPDWAKSPYPPSYSYSDVGALNAYSYVDGVGFNGGSNINHYNTCSTSASTAAKTVSKSNFQLSAGAEIIVQFIYTNTASYPTLNVNSTGAKSIYYNGTNIPASALAANRVYKFVYDGSYWQLVGTLGYSKTSELTNDAGFLTSNDVVDEVNLENKPVTSNAVYEYITEDEKVIASALNDLNTNKQDTLVSGTNIKTINNQSLLGEGNITISGGGSGGENNVIESISVNSVAQTVDANKNVNLQFKTINNNSISGTGNISISASTPVIEMYANYDDSDVGYLENFAFVDASAAYSTLSANSTGVIVSIEARVMEGNTIVFRDYFYTLLELSSDSTPKNYFFYFLIDNEKYNINLLEDISQQILTVGYVSHETMGGGEENVIETVKVNGTALTPDSNKAVNISAVTSFNGSTGAITYSAPVTSVNGNTGAVVLNIPAAVTESTVSGWGFTKNAGTITGVTGSNGLTGSGTSGSVTISHAAPSTSPAKTTSAVYPITIDLYGHITAAGSAVTIPTLVTESTVSGWGFTKNNGTLTGVTFNGTSATITNGVAAISATIPSAPGTLNTNNTTAQTASSSETLSGTIKLHKVAKTGTYSDLIGTPTNVSTFTNDANYVTADNTVAVYSGSSAPSSSLGKNGDIYILTT